MKNRFEQLYPWLDRLPWSLARELATLGPLGYSPKAPGTVGTLAGFTLALVLVAGLSPLAYLFVCLILIYLAVGVCEVAERALGKVDPPEIVLDEFVAAPVCFLGVQAAIPAMREAGTAWLLLVVGFAVFRFFDIFKPLGINRLQRIPGGAGCVADDVAAALATAVCVHLTAIFLV